MYSQEVLTFSGYDGTAINLTATTATVNDDITIVFEDLNIIDNFYTQFQNEIYMFGGLTTDDGSFQFAPAFSDLGAQPQLTLVASDGDNNAGPNTYSITINLAQQYSVPEGTTVYGFNLLFQNQFGGGGNNQTVDLFIDLVDDVTLNIQEYSNMPTVRIVRDEIITQNYQGELTVSVYDVSGRLTNSFVEVVNSATFRTVLDLPKKQMNIIVVEGSSFTKTFKNILN
jgi:hypothetical protein